MAGTAAQTVEVPFLTVDNRLCLTAVQVYQLPWLRKFVEQFPASFERDPIRDVYWFYPPEDFPS